MLKRIAATVNIMFRPTPNFFSSSLISKTLSKYLVENGVGLESLGRRQDTLEDYFFQLTEEGD